MRRPSRSSGTITVAGAGIHYARAGTGPRNLVLLHGLTDDGSCWTRVEQALRSDFDIVMPDARGHGRSARVGRDGFSVPLLAADVVGLLDRLEIRHALIFGHSMGAITAAVVAAERPDLVRAMVLEDPPLDMVTPPVAIHRQRISADVESWRALHQPERHARAQAEHAGWHRLETDAWADAKAALDSAVLDHLDLFDEFDWRGVFARLTVPGLLVTGDPDLGAIVTEATAAEAARLWRRARVLRINDAGHCIHRDRWPETMGSVRSYLREQATAAG